ncbi:hypothetical protein H072_2650 [Dactylellina haptotyla CBS 200.50]|uniref:Integral membrane protein n=1 Tax=Dactylellina haptotyla (strain CBS 200.50) TaxID=1284197 RepID=S8C6P4_DACHA|nr:hypothetical protein H072_2650 [Dactylellina haptotyla CBS 200.50]
MARTDHSSRPAGLQEAGGPFSYLNPTRGFLSVAKEKYDADNTQHMSESHPGVFQVWSSRANRKGRHPIAIDQEAFSKADMKIPPVTNNFTSALRGIKKMAIWYPIWDVSYDVAMIFTIGSVVWVINSFFVWLPLAAPSTEFAGEVSTGGGVTAFIGATIFEIGSVLLMLEAVNENRSECFGWAIEETLENGKRFSMRPHRAGCNHSHPHKRAFLNHGGRVVGDAGGSGRLWTWWPSWYELKTHYFKEVGFLACFSQLIGATVFWISGFAGLSPIYNSLSVPAANCVYWLPQVIGGTGFIISSCLFMLETQHAWYVPNLYVLGWHIGFWNFVGAIGFTLCGALGFGIENDAVAYASTLSTFVGSWAFLIGSVIQWFESLNKFPVVSNKKAS